MLKQHFRPRLKPLVDGLRLVFLFLMPLDHIRETFLNCQFPPLGVDDIPPRVMSSRTYRTPASRAGRPNARERHGAPFPPHERPSWGVGSRTSPNGLLILGQALSLLKPITTFIDLAKAPADYVG